MWIFNLFLYLCWLAQSPVYQELRDNGATCYVYVSDHGEDAETVAPPCFYGSEAQ
jgi:hypothetical protein